MANRKATPDMAGTPIPDELLFYCSPAALHEMLDATKRVGNFYGMMQIIAHLTHRTAPENITWPWLRPTEPAPYPEPRKRRNRVPKNQADLEG